MGSLLRRNPINSYSGKNMCAVCRVVQFFFLNLGWTHPVLKKMGHFIMPIGSMYGIVTYIYHKDQPNVGEYTIHWSYGMGVY